MQITLTLGDFLAIAAIVVIFSGGARMVSSWPSPQQLRMQRQLDAIMKHLALPEPPVSRIGALSAQVTALLAAGRKADAIRLYRQETGEGLKQARAAVDAAPTSSTTGR